MKKQKTIKIDLLSAKNADLQIKGEYMKKQSTMLKKTVTYFDKEELSSSSSVKSYESFSQSCSDYYKSLKLKQEEERRKAEDDS